MVRQGVVDFCVCGGVCLALGFKRGGVGVKDGLDLLVFVSLEVYGEG